MERLTERKQFAYYPRCFKQCDGLGSSEECNNCDFSYAICDKLAAYEETGLTPEEIISVIKKGVPSWIPKYLEYRKAEEQGILIKLPCKVGDTVWDIDFGRPTPSMIVAFSLGIVSDDEDENGDEEEIRMYSIGSGIESSFLASEIGKTVFLTKEEAEEALKGSTPSEPKTPHEIIQDYINKCRYTYKVEDIIEDYQKKYTKGYYVSYTMKDCITHLEDAIKEIIKGLEG